MRIRIKYTVAHKFKFDLMSTEQVEAARIHYYRKALFFLVCGSVSVITFIISIVLSNFLNNPDIAFIFGILFWVFLVLSILLFWRWNIFDGGRKDCDAELEKRAKILESDVEEENDKIN